MGGGEYGRWRVWEVEEESGNRRDQTHCYGCTTLSHQHVHMVHKVDTKGS